MLNCRFKVLQSTRMYFIRSHTSLHAYHTLSESFTTRIQFSHTLLWNDCCVCTFLKLMLMYTYRRINTKLPFPKTLANRSLVLVLRSCKWTKHSRTSRGAADLLGRNSTSTLIGVIIYVLIGKGSGKICWNIRYRDVKFWHLAVVPTKMTTYRPFTEISGSPSGDSEDRPSLD
jgi:hypothetical protein